MELKVRRRHPPSEHVPGDQLRYARLLDYGTIAGAVVLAIAFGAYVLGLLHAGVALARLPALWTLSARAYLAGTGSSAGWAWIGRLDQGENASLLGIAILAGCTVACIAAAKAELAGHRPAGRREVHDGRTVARTWRRT